MTPLISFGESVRQPDRLRAEPMAAVLCGIAEGRWGTQVESVRQLPYRSTEQLERKQTLPFWTPGGLFRYRSNAGLIEHSGHVAVDLDELGTDGATRVIQAAVEDPHCKCAFRSATVQGVRLIFPCPPCSAAVHRSVFHRVAEHVRIRYGVEPDRSGSDVARASFVSWDAGLWLNLQATMLPGLAELVTAMSSPNYTHGLRSMCVVGGLTEGDRATLAWGLGESRAPSEARAAGGTCATHLSLRDLARDLVVRHRKHGLELLRPDIDCALGAWWDTAKRRGLKFRLRRDDYLVELLKGVHSVQRSQRLDAVVWFWRRWTQEPDFPLAGSAEQRLEYAIRRHCMDAGTDRFFLSARDAATITGTSFKAANDTLHRLVKAGVLERDGRRKRCRDAQGYKLRTC